MPRIEIVYTCIYTCVRMCVCVRLLTEMLSVCTGLTASASCSSCEGDTHLQCIMCDSGKIGSHMLCDSVGCSV